ncbi:cysteine hydrolase family protein [Roseomonas gilardii subsp. gilardii]|uniref:cysteine hydrolase n=1 Tax=Roseomonas gilardii TaxID=257708 RepID=UPI001FFB746B|nr:cysteine hydrolase family protein [Roseomonas gilardii]UPG71732.1 cysteine hydrolase family protein [Roseomonas gilardii subsp. gilardii]
MNRREHLKLAGAALAATALPSTLARAEPTGSAIDRSRSALIFIEFQNEWLEPTAPLNRLMEDRPQLDEAVRNAARLIERARHGGFPVVHAGLSLVDDPTYEIFGGGKNKAGLRGAIPRAGTWRDPQRVAFPEPFTPAKGEFVVAGRSGASVLTNSNLDAYLRNNRIDQIYLLGFALHVCVESTLRHAHDLGYEATVISDAAPAFTAAQRDHVLTDVVHHFGHHITTEQFLRDWSSA